MEQLSREISIKKTDRHSEVVGATCYCGDKLIVAPKAIHLLHAAENPKDELIVCCRDFAHQSYFYDGLVPGNQPHPNQDRIDAEAKNEEYCRNNVVKGNVYEHYKGGFYKVIVPDARWAHTGESLVVCVDADEFYEKSIPYVRSHAEFSFVFPDGTPRFKYLRNEE